MISRSLVACLALSATLVSSAVYAGDPASCVKPRFSGVGWTDITATTQIASQILKGLGYKPDQDGWLGTGDVGTIDPDGFVQLTDRLKDVIKSGGEWISSIEIENLVMSHPDVFEAAVIAVEHPVWQERPLLIVQPRDGRKPSKQSPVDFLAGKLPKWQVPDDVVFVDSLPHTATGKLLKTELRQRFHGHLAITA